MLPLLLLRSKGGFSPIQISGLQAWYDFSDQSTLFTDDALTTPVSADGDVIGSVKDKSSLSHNVIQATANNKPLYKVNIQNGKSIGRFDGTNDYLQSASFTLNQPEQIFAVVINRGLTGAGQLSILDGRTAIRMWLFEQSSKIYVYAGTDPIGGQAYAIDEIALMTALLSGASSYLSKNQAVKVTGPAGTNNGGGVTLGAKADGGFPGQSDICEVLIFNVAVTDAEKVQIENYLNIKWSIFTMSINTFTYPSTIEA